MAIQTGAMLDCEAASNRPLEPKAAGARSLQFSVSTSVVESRPNLSDRQEIDSPWSRQPVEHLLVATDLTPRSDRAIERSLLMADLLGAQMTLLHVVDEGLPRRLIKHRRREAQALLQAHVRMLLSPNHGRDVSINVRTGDICAEIAREAIELGSDAIVLGMHGQHSIGHGRNEYTAVNVAHYSDRPILVVRHQPTGPYRCAIIHLECFSKPPTALWVASRLAPRAEPHIIDPNSAIVPSIGAREAHAAPSSHSLRTNTRDIGTRPEPIAVGLPSVLRAAVDTFQGDLLVVEVCHSEEKRDVPLDDW